MSPSGHHIAFRADAAPERLKSRATALSHHSEPPGHLLGEVSQLVWDASLCAPPPPRIQKSWRTLGDFRRTLAPCSLWTVESFCHCVFLKYAKLMSLHVTSDVTVICFPFLTPVLCLAALVCHSVCEFCLHEF